jgi:SAM-dependent methyltransferase
MLAPDFIKGHHLSPEDPYFLEICRNPAIVGLTPEDLEGKTETRVRELIIGEYYAALSKYAGQMASRFLMKVQWGYGHPDWFDHRHHFLDPETQCNDFWAMSADNVIQVHPLNGRMLNLCAGDAFYDFYFYRQRSSEIVCVDLGKEAYRHYLRHHQAANIVYHFADVLNFPISAGEFDTVVIRGAIEHFSQANQQKIFLMAKDSLKPGGWFCGDTPANHDQSHKMLHAHESQMRTELSRVFEKVETQTLFSKERTTLFWRCQKLV